MRTVGLTRPPTSDINKGPGEGDGSATGEVPHRVELPSRTSKFSASAAAVVGVESVCRRCGGGNNNNVGVVSISVGGVGKGGGGGDGGEANGGVSCVVVVAFVFCVCQS